MLSTPVWVIPGRKPQWKVFSWQSSFHSACKEAFFWWQACKKQRSTWSDCSKKSDLGLHLLPFPLCLLETLLESRFFCLVDNSILINWMSPFFISGMPGVPFQFQLIFGRNSCMQTVETLIRCFAASNLGLHCLPTVMILSFWTDRSGQTVQTQIRLRSSLIRVYTVCNSVCIF